MRHHSPVFDTCGNSDHRPRSVGHPSLIGVFRRTLREREAGPPSAVLTGLLLGDPTPDRPRPGDDIPPDVRSRICTESGPVLLTFRELEAAKRLRGEGRA